MNKSSAINSVLILDQKHQLHNSTPKSENQTSPQDSDTNPLNSQHYQNAPLTKVEIITWVLNNLNKPAFPISPQQSLLNNKEPKQPAYYDDKYYKTLNWKSYQNWHELEPGLRNQLIEKWHKDKRSDGVSTLGGWNGRHWLGWIDFDLKDFNSTEKMDTEIANWVNKYPILEESPHFTTPGGGHRFLVAWNSEPKNFGANSGFSLIPESTERMGELLTLQGGMTILPPTLGANGKPYQWVNFADYPPIVNSPEEVGIFPVLSKAATRSKTQSANNNFQSVSKSTSTRWEKYLDEFEFRNNETVPLEVAIAPSHRELIDSGVPEGSRDNTAAAIARDLVGTDNYLQSEGQAVEGTPEELLNHFGDRCIPPLSDSDINRILNSAQRSNPEPSLDYYKIKSCVASYFWRNGDKSSWKTTLKKTSTKPQPPKSESNLLSLQDAVELARATLTKGLDDLSLNIELENIRIKTSASQSFWDRKIIAPLKRELEGARFKADLKLILQESDKIEQIRKIAQLATRYQMSAGTIKAALETMRSQIVTPEVKALSLIELFNLESTGLDWLVPSFIPKNETVILAGSPKAGKTVLSIDLAFALATGEDYALGQTVPGGKKVLIVECDESPQSTKTKLLKRGFRKQDNELIKVLNNWNITQLPQLELLLSDFRPDLVIIDSLRRINHGSELSENSAEFADNIYTLKETLQRYEASGILIHHTNKDPESMGVNKLRGSSAIAGAVWGTITLDHIPKPDPNNKKKLIIDPRDPNRILNLHARDAEGQSLQIELNPENNSWSVLGEVGVDEELKAERESLRQSILNILNLNIHKDGLGGRDIIECLDNPEVNPHSVYATLNRLVNQKVISSKSAENDLRYTVYYLPQTNQVIENNSLIEEKFNTPPDSHNPPPPPPTDQNVIYSEPINTQQGIQDRQHYITLDNKIDNIQNELLLDEEAQTNTEQELETETPIDNNLDNTEGGGVMWEEGVLNSSSTSPPLVDNKGDLLPRENQSVSNRSGASGFKVGDRVAIKRTKITGLLVEYSPAGKTWTIKTDPGFSVPFECKTEDMLVLLEE